jgi:predicted TIM-barrel fold metal-dependent hydrolase
VYNDWLAEFCAAAPRRLIGAGFLPVKGPVEWTIQEARRCAKIGLKSISIPQFVDERPYHRPEWEPFWRAAEELDLPISIHVGTGISLHGSFAQAEHVGRFFHNHMATCMGDLVWGAVLQKHPRLRFVGVECGIGWIAHQLNGWDRFWEDHKWIRPKLEEPPSFYFKRQFWATFERDRAGILTRELLNVDHLMWGSDYPHLEGTFPASAKMVAQIFAGIPEDETRKMVRDNCARLYQL